MKIGKRLRDLLLVQFDTEMLNSHSCYYRGEKYTFLPVTPHELNELTDRVMRNFGLGPYKKRHWWDIRRWKN